MCGRSLHLQKKSMTSFVITKQYLTSGISTVNAIKAIKYTVQ